MQSALPDSHRARVNDVYEKGSRARHFVRDLSTKFYRRAKHCMTIYTSACFLSSIHQAYENTNIIDV